MYQSRETNALLNNQWVWKKDKINENKTTLQKPVVCFINSSKKDSNKLVQLTVALN